MVEADLGGGDGGEELRHRGGAVWRHEVSYRHEAVGGGRRAGTLAGFVAPAALVALVALVGQPGAWGTAWCATAAGVRANGPTPLGVEQAFEDLKSGDWILKWAAMTQLARWRVKEATPALRGILGGKEHPWVRGRALVALAELLGEEVLADAEGRAKDAVPALREAAVEALGIIGSPKGEAAIGERLKDDVPAVRYQAVVALARVKREGAWETVAPLLDDKDPLLVERATEALVYVNTPAAHRRAMELLGHADGGVRVAAARTLRHALVPEAIPVLLLHMATDGEPRVRVACEAALVAFEGGSLFLPLLAALRGVQPEQYGAALSVLAAKPVEEACDGVAALLREPDSAYRDVIPAALHLLTRLEPDRYEELFVRYLGHPSALVRCKAIESIGRCQKADRFKLLRPLLVDKDQHVRAVAFRAVRELAETPPPGGMVDYLADALQHPDRWTHRAATDLLCERITAADLPRAIAALAPVLASKSKEDREYVAKALARIGDEAARRRIAAAQGYVTDWMLIGPFPYDSRGKGFGPSYFPEHEIDFAKSYPPVVSDPTAVFRVAEVTCGGEKKKALVMQPGTGRGGAGRLVATFRLELPEGKDLKLSMALGIEDGADDTDGVGFEVLVNELKLLERKVAKPGGWQAAEVSLADFSGKRVTVELAVDPLGNPKGDRAAIGEPVLLAGEQVVARLEELADTAPVRVVVPDEKARLAWQRVHAGRVDGEVALYDVYPAPLDAKLAYGVADITVPEERKATVWVKSDDGCIVWLNGVQALSRAGAGEEKREVVLRAGANRLLIKVYNLREWWLYHVRLTDADGRALAFRQEGQ